MGICHGLSIKKYELLLVFDDEEQFRHAIENNDNIEEISGGELLRQDFPGVFIAGAVSNPDEEFAVWRP